MIKKCITAVLILILTFSTIGGVKPSHAANGLELFTPATGISVSPGESVDYDMELINDTGSIQEVAFDIKGLPKNWEAQLAKDGRHLSQLAVKPGSTQPFTLTVKVPLKVDKGDYSFTVVADGDRASDELPLSVTVSEKGTFQTLLDVEQPNLEGHADSDFTYTATLNNRTAEKQRYGLTADAPDGWDVQFKADGQNVTSVEVEPNDTQDIDVTLNPPEKVKAGEYKVQINASSGSTSAKNVLEAVITGTFDLELTTPDGKLNTDITAGDEKTVKVQLNNKGSAPLRNIELSAETPPDWNVTFDPETVEKLDPEQSAVVNATITASDEAIAGDYVVDMSASSDEASADAQFRVSVKTSLLWGWVGVLIVVAVLAGIYYLFRKYGRR